MPLSETESTGIKISETEGTGVTLAECEATDVKLNQLRRNTFRHILNFSWLLLLSQITIAEVGYIHETTEEGVYEGMIVDSVGNSMLFEGIITGNQFDGFITKVEPVGLTDSVDDGTGDLLDSVDDGTGGILNSVDDLIGNMLTIVLSCDIEKSFEVSVENESSDGLMFNFELTNLYLNGTAQSCSQ